MNKIEILDTTLRDGEQAPDNSMSPKEKLKVALALENLGVDIIEAGFPISSKEDFEAIRLISRKIKKSRVCALARCNNKDIDSAYLALKDSKDKSLHLFFATSDLHLKNKYKISRKRGLEIIRETLRYASTKFDHIIFSAEDGSRSDIKYLIEVFKEATKFKGVKVLGIADTVGYAQPAEMYKIVSTIKSSFPKHKIGVHCHNDLGLATANTLASISAGAEHVQLTINGIGERSGNTSLEEVVMATQVRQKYYKATSKIDIKGLMPASKLVYKVLKRKPSHEKAIVGPNSFRHEAGIHVDGIKKDERTYEIINPESLGAKREFVEGKHSSKKHAKK